VPRTRRPSPQTIAVLHALADQPSTWRYGYELGRQVSLPAGSLYPILMRLTDRGLLESTWESDPPAGRPPRHLYRLTEPGLELAAATPAAKAPAAKATATAKPSATRAAPSTSPAVSLRPAEPRGAW
jgi:PadR family transcriptional regulator PadR